MCDTVKKIVTNLMLGMLLLCLPVSMTYAKAGCCSHHGGVASCDASTGHLKCKDGTDSKTCPCNGTTTTPTTSKVKKTEATTSAGTTTTATATTKTKAPKGCCSKHGGVGSCNTTTGYYMCKDGTQSGTCKCQ